MNTYYFNKDARIQFKSEAEIENDARAFFQDAILKCELEYGIRITIDSLKPEKTKEG